ncbi:molybdopterin-binding protein [Petroclostridium sp. X23]|uniref:molybdopterin-binding protein n=1 Tax=Petroclostridium sp. X23 TaxID=3045146 RepID=UPI0024ACC0B9|nr:molybdopterin-binding protein [Petroclostridium sp. X23]WHH60493.1 molybdopterin-binding protein [Petroclostridium sp. X23]
MKKVKVQEAVGAILCHDMTKIIPGEFKGRAFKKGHIITEEDIPELLNIGKEHIYIWEKKEHQAHEDEAATYIAEKVAGAGLRLTAPCNGRVDLIADYEGMLVIDEELLFNINMVDEIVVASLNNKRWVKKDDVIAGIRVIPIVIEKENLFKVGRYCELKKVLTIKPFRPLSVGIVTTGSEVYSGRIVDKFGPIVEQKVRGFGCVVKQKTILPDDDGKICDAVKGMVQEGVEMVVVTGGMSVDPDDVTPAGIKKTGANIVTYGAPVLPGSMILIAYLDGVPVLGLPGCVMYDRTTIFDLILPMILAKKEITKKDIVKFGMGGLCRKCRICRYPECSFGTGA